MKTNFFDSFLFRCVFFNKFYSRSMKQAILVGFHTNKKILSVDVVDDDGWKFSVFFKFSLRTFFGRFDFA